MIKWIFANAASVERIFIKQESSMNKVILSQQNQSVFIQDWRKKMKKTPHNLTKAFLIVALMTLLQIAARAQAPQERQVLPGTVRATGEATVTAKPDQAQIDIGVVAQAESAQTAATENAQKLDGVIAELKKTLGPNADIKTISYSLNPNYRYPQNGGQPTVTGYTATNVVRVKIDNLEQVGKVIDISTRSGANNIQSLSFMLKDEESVKAEALRQAAKKAQAKARTLASALGLNITRIIQVEEGGPQVRPIMDSAERFMTAQAAKVQTPVEPGTIEVQATVTLTVQVN